MKYILYNPKESDISNLKKAGVLDKNILILNKESLRSKIKFHKVKTRSWLQKWSYTKINGKSVKEIFSINDQTIFYLLSYFFLREFFLFKKSVGLNLTFTLIDTLYNFIDDDVSVIAYDPHNGYFVSLLNKICIKKKCTLCILKSENKRIGNFEFLRNYAWPIKRFVALKIWIRYLIGIIRQLLGYHCNKRATILFLSNIRFSRKREEDNVMFGTVIRELNARSIKNKSVNYDLPNKKGHLNEVLLNFMFSKTNYIGDYYSLKLLQDNEKLFKMYQKKWKVIRDTNKLKNSFTYRGINIYEFVAPLFDLIFNALFYLVADNLNLTKTLLKREAPSVFVLDHEDNFYGKGLMINAKNTKIKSVCLQHEVIEPTDCNHSHIKDKKALIKKTVFWRPLPDKKCVWSTYSKKVLLNLCNYPPRNIIITGNPRFDDLINKKFETKNIFNKYHIPSNAKLVLYATEDKDDSVVFFKSLDKIKGNFFFLIKPHPSENFNFYKKLKKGCQNKNLILFSKRANMYKLISIADVLITKMSTVGIEAMIKGVPVIIFNPNNDPDPWGYVKSGAALIAKNVKDLEKKLSLITDTAKLKNNGDERVKNFIVSRAYKQDGKATKRVANSIKKLI